MNSTAHFVMLCGCFMGIVTTLHPQTVHQDKQIPSPRRVGGSQEVMIEVLSTTTNRGVRVRGRRVCYRTSLAYFGFREIPIPVEAPVTAFMTKRGEIWVGREMDFYIETDAGVVGGRRSSASIAWHGSWISKRQNEKVDLNSLMRRFEKEMTADKWSEIFGDPNLEKQPERLTKLWPMFQKLGTAWRESDQELRATDLTNGILRLDWNSKDRHDSGSVWIEIKSRKLVKAVEDGKQVFPK